MLAVCQIADVIQNQRSQTQNGKEDKMLFEDMEIKNGRVVTKDAGTEEELVVVVRDPDDSLIDFLKALARHANPGHTFTVIMDPEGDNQETFGFDGDGSFRIVSINGSNKFGKTNDERGMGSCGGERKFDGSGMGIGNKNLAPEELFKDMCNDQINYYDLIVSIARQMNNPRITKEDVKNRLVRMFKQVVERPGLKNQEGEYVKFDEGEFDNAFHQFRTAKANRMVYRPT
jgi:hypothetical protein